MSPRRFLSGLLVAGALALVAVGVPGVACAQSKWPLLERQYERERRDHYLNERSREIDREIDVERGDDAVALQPLVHAELVANVLALLPIG
jgi:hypothetical protein